jgi:hypothetical protein
MAKKYFWDRKSLYRRTIITTPYNRTKTAKISEIQKEKNKEISLRRISTQYLICRIKNFRVASNTFRNGNMWIS